MAEEAKKLAKGMEVAFAEMYKYMVQLRGRGFLGAMTTIATSSLKLKMSTDEFIEMLDKSRDTVMALGGGVVGIDKFTDMIDRASEGLEYLGKDGKKAAASFMSSFIKGGAGVDEFMKNSRKLNDQFRTLQSTVGTTVEEFADYLDEINNGQLIQSKLNLGDKAAAAQMRNEAVARTEQYAALQLTTKQMTEMNKTLESMYNPNKNKQAESIKSAQMGRLAVSSTSQSMRSNGQGDVADVLDQGLRDGSLSDLLRNPLKAKDPKYASLMQALSKMKDYNASLRNGDTFSMKNYAGVEFADRSSSLQQLQSVGGIMNNAQNVRGPASGYAQQRANAIAGSGGEIGPNGQINDTTLTKIKNDYVTIYEQASSVMKNAFTPAVIAAAASLATLVGPGRLLGLARGAAGVATGWGAGAAGAGAGAGAGAAGLGLLGSTAAVAGAGVAGYAVGTGINNMPRLWGGRKLSDHIADGLNSGNDAKVAAMLRGNGGTVSKPSGGQAGASNQSSAKYIADQLMKNGYTKEQAAGIVGSLMQESNLNPGAVNPSSGAQGIGQWLGSRKKDFESFSGTSLSGSTLEQQTAFMINELKNKERRAGSMISGAQTPEQAALFHSKFYERPGAAEANNGKRMANAQQVYSMIDKAPVATDNMPNAAATTSGGDATDDLMIKQMQEQTSAMKQVVYNTGTKNQGRQAAKADKRTALENG
jgi:hypothetical protein